MNLRNVGKKGIPYSIGLDLGTGSVGWAIIDDTGELFHFKGKPTWGSRLFPSADTASEARVNRGQRRRYDRRRQRLNLLQEFFMPAMDDLDPDFFIRLNQSRLLKEDRDPEHSDYRWPIFNESDFTERDYYRQFRTIYHLRKWLIETDKQADLRLVYLALHNIVKARGNFLWQDTPLLSARNADVGAALTRLSDALQLWFDDHDLDGFEKLDCSGIREIIAASKPRRDKRESLSELLHLGNQNKRMAKAIAGAVFGYQVEFADIFGEEVKGENSKIDLDNDDKVAAFLSVCPDDGIELFDAMRMLRSAIILLSILEGGDGHTISFHKIAQYEKYGRDLKTLKDLVKQYTPAQYDGFFRGQRYDDPRWSKDYDSEKAQGYTLYNKKRGRAYDDFRKDVEKLFKGTDAVKDERYIQMMEDFTEEKFLRRLKTSDNGSIPYQLHLEEMRAIIERQGKYYPFLLEEQEKLESLVSFRIPYYVGPLTQKNARRDAKGNARFAWSQRVEGEAGKQKITPWNWDQVIDKDASAEAFIRRMTGDCTYLYGEPVLPKCSLIYERFCVLNELNGARFSYDGDTWYRFDYATRVELVHDLFERKASVTYAQVADWMKVHNRDMGVHVRGGQGVAGFESKLTSHRFFCKVLGIDDLTGATAEMVEEIILWNTLFEDRDILKRRIVQKYGEQGNGLLNAKQIAQICRKRFTGWGRLSRKLLCEVKADIDGRSFSIMDVLEEGTPCGKHIGSAMVFMEVLRDNTMGFQDKIDAINKEKAAEQGGFSIEDMPGSPALRRSVNQALRIVDEIVKIAGGAPAHIYIETTRDDDPKRKGKRTTQKYDQLVEALRAFKDDATLTPGLMDQLKGQKGKELDDALRLYFLQNGKCMYTGKPLDINFLGTGLYQIDHIIPQCYVKDDSLDNRVLVLASANQTKSDQMLIPAEVRRRMAPMWRELRRAHAISEKKFNNLMRSEIGDVQARGFVARQLVETSQVVKYVRTMLEERYPDSDVRSIKASLSHQLREAEHFVKCREANDYHHAHDALIACEIGRFIQMRFGDIFDNPVRLENAMRSYVRELSVEYRQSGRMPGDPALIVGSFRRNWVDSDTGEILWEGKAETGRIRRFLDYKDCYISRMPEITSGAFWDATIYSPKSGRTTPKYRLKTNLDVEKYGGYSGGDYAYFFIYSINKRGKTMLRFDGVPVPLAQRIEESNDALVEYAKMLSEDEQAVFVSIVRDRVFKKQLFEIEGCRLYVAGLTWAYCAAQLGFAHNQVEVISNLTQQLETTIDERVMLFDALCEKTERLSSFHASKIALESRKKQFADLNEGQQAQLLLGLLAWANGTTNKVDLSPVGGAVNGAQQKITYNKELNVGEDHFVIIDQSVTGMFERRQRIGL